LTGVKLLFLPRYCFEAFGGYFSTEIISGDPIGGYLFFPPKRRDGPAVSTGSIALSAKYCRISLLRYDSFSGPTGETIAKIFRPADENFSYAAAQAVEACPVWDHDGENHMCLSSRLAEVDPGY